MYMIICLDNLTHFHFGSIRAVRSIDRVRNRLGRLPIVRLSRCINLFGQLWHPRFL